MLPQMMPLPWVLVFVSLFFVYFTFLLYVGGFALFSFSQNKKVLELTPFFPW